MAGCITMGELAHRIHVSGQTMTIVPHHAHLHTRSAHLYHWMTPISVRRMECSETMWTTTTSSTVARS